MNEYNDEDYKLGNPKQQKKVEFYAFFGTENVHFEFAIPHKFDVGNGVMKNLAF